VTLLWYLEVFLPERAFLSFTSLPFLLCHLFLWLGIFSNSRFEFHQVVIGVSFHGDQLGLPNVFFRAMVSSFSFCFFSLYPVLRHDILRVCGCTRSSPQFKLSLH